MQKNDRSKGLLARAVAFARSKRPQQRAAGAQEPGPFAIGRLVVERRAPGAAWEKIVDDANLVVLQAQNLQAQMAIGVVNSAFNYIELGNPVTPTPPALGDIALQSSTGTRKAATLTASTNVATAEVLFLTAEGNGFTYTEAGLFTGPFAAGSMFARKIFAGITKTNAFELRFRWHITFLVQTNGGSDCTGIGIIGPSTVTSFVYQSAAGGENSVAANFDFGVGANNLDVFLNGQRLAPTVQYNEAGVGALTAPILGSSLNKGINLVGFSLATGDKVLLVLRTQA